MASFNKVILVGNLTRDVELRFTPSGTPVADVGLAVNERRKGKNDETIEETVFVDVTLWARNAEVANQYLVKGSPVLIEGRLKLDTWESQEGERRSKIKVVAERMQMLARKGDTPSNGDASKPQLNDADTGGGNDDEVPF
jgi:single-strand DNA-binding protein